MRKHWHRSQDLFKEFVIQSPNKGLRVEGDADPRDYLASDYLGVGETESIPSYVDNYNSFTYNQGATNHCTAYATAMICTMQGVRDKRKKEIYFDPEQQWQNQLMNPGTATESMGDYLNSAVKALKAAGLTDPATGLKFKSDLYLFAPKTEWRQRLADGHAILVGGKTVRPFTTSDHYWRVPQKGKETGGHAWVIVGYDDLNERYICQNSWGKWGEGRQGRFYVRYSDAPELFRGWIINGSIS